MSDALITKVFDHGERLKTLEERIGPSLATLEQRIRALEDEAEQQRVNREQRERQEMGRIRAELEQAQQQLATLKGEG